MRDILTDRLNKLKRIRIRRTRMLALLLVLSLIVSGSVFWYLRKPGLALAGDASCGVREHTHTDACGTKTCICTLPEEVHDHTESCYIIEETESGPVQALICPLPEGRHVHGDACYEAAYTCGLAEHVHTIDCYADLTADVESALDWQAMFANYPYTGSLRKDLVGIAQTQVGYTESTLNYEPNADGSRRGYTRYGAWYGAPYSDWSAMFVSFCLHYAGADPADAPGNTGAAAMLQQWQSRDKFAPLGSCPPAAGDLVFFTNNTVGIVAEVYSGTFYVIRGDIDNAVQGSMLPLSDASIAGWGITEGTAPTAEPAISEEHPALPEAADAPVFTISADLKQQRLLRTTLRQSGARTSDIIDLLTYINSLEPAGTISFSLLSLDSEALPKDDNGNLIVQAGTGYKLTIAFKSPSGIAPGTYQYQIPNGLLVNGGFGTFALTDKTVVGSWSVTDEGLITLVMNEEMNNRTNVTISATMGIVFPDTDQPIGFDDKTVVTVIPPPDNHEPTQLKKWGYQGSEGNAQNKTDPSKLYWTIEMTGKKDSHIPGSIITDKVVQGNHHYSESDIAAGLRIGVSERDPATGAEINWHYWVVSADDPNLTWTETGWTYNIPDTVTCQYCGALPLGNDGWVYSIDYTSTPRPESVPGKYDYANFVQVDGQEVYGWTNFLHGSSTAQIEKNGSFVGDADGGSFLWEIQATIPGRQPEQVAQHFWFIMDEMKLISGADDSLLAYIKNDVNKATVTAQYNGQTITVPHVSNATDSDPFAWHISWSPTANGVSYKHQIDLLCHCDCTEETCPYWGWDAEANKYKCTYEYWYTVDNINWYRNNFCQCWTAQNDATFTFSYETNDLDIIEKYGGTNKALRNSVLLLNKPKNSGNDGVKIDDDDATVPVPSIFKKELIDEFDGYRANYEITINEAKVTLTAGGTPLLIHDEMTETLAYISGSLVIDAEDANGTKTRLQQGTDYAVVYDGSGKEKDDYGSPVHVLDIEIFQPQPVMYVLNYDTTLIIPDDATQVPYSNSASISLWGDALTDSSTQKIYADINIAAHTYSVEMYKTSSQTGEPLAKALFGLYNKQGGLISTDETDENGYLLFETDIQNGIVLREHELYYMQELKAPSGYRLDDTKHWFCFCSTQEPSCDTCQQVMDEMGVTALRIPFDQIGHVDFENELLHYDLPATGSRGLYPFVVFGVTFVLTPLTYLFILRRKRNRRDEA